MKLLVSAALCALAAGMAAPAAAQTAPSAEAAAPAYPLTPQGAADFVAAAEKDLFDFGVEYARVQWLNYTYINDTSDALAATYGARDTEKSVHYALEAAKYAAVPGLDPEVKRKLDKLRSRIVMPDLRAHGQSAKPHEREAYPHDVLVRDAEALVEHLGLHDYDLGGFSLGARTAVRCVLAGLRPGKLVLGGMGLEGLAGWDRRAAFFIDAIDRFEEVKHGDPAFMAVAFMKTQKVDRVAARLLLQAVDDTPESEIAGVTMPTLVVCGEKDQDNGSPEALAAALPDGRFAEIPGTHMSSVTEPELSEAIVRFLKA